MARASAPATTEPPFIKRDDPSRLREVVGVLLSIGQFFPVFIAFRFLPAWGRLLLSFTFALIILLIFAFGTQVWNGWKQARGYSRLEAYAIRTRDELSDARSANADLLRQLQSNATQLTQVTAERDTAQAQIVTLSTEASERDEQIKALNALAQALIDLFTSGTPVDWATREVELVSIRNIPPPHHLQLRAKTCRRLKEGDRILVLDFAEGVPRGLFAVLPPTGRIHTARHTAIDQRWWAQLCRKAELGDRSLPAFCKAILLSQEESDAA